MILRLVLLSALSPLLTAISPTVVPVDDPAQTLVAGVRSIAKSGTPGVVAVFGENAFPVVVGKISDDVRAPVVAAAEFGKGRIVAFAHSGYFAKDTLRQEDGARFMENCVRWAARKPKGKVSIRVSDGNAEFIEFLNAAGFDARATSGLRNLSTSDTDVLFQFKNDSGDDAAAVESFVAKGGGLFVAQTPWGWMQLNPGKSLATDHPGNALLVKAGLAWVDGTLDATAAGAFTVGPTPEFVHASHALDALLAAKNTARWKKADAAQARWSILAPLSVLAADDKVLRPRLAKLTARADSVIPSANAPLKDKDLVARIAFAVDMEERLAAAPADVRAHPAAAEFPGSVSAQAPRVTRTIEIDTRIPNWHSTGLYAAPGEIVEVELPSNSKAKNLTVQIGAHTDDLTDKDAWSRCPRVVVKTPITQAKTQLASPFGGLVYVLVPKKAAHETVKLLIANVVEAPRFIAGETDVAQWKSKLRALPGPWAEIETKKVIITVPAEFVRNLDNPDELCVFWDRVMDAIADLAGIPHERERPERYVTDQQISAGYMHSGYPIMTHLDVAPRFVDLAALATDKEGCGWGFYHEMGHNHQEPEWTFGGTGEVTCNFFAVYVLDTVVKAENGRVTAAECRKRFDEYRKSGAKYEDWKSEPFLALGFFLELKREFGWPAFQKFFAEHAALPAAERPRTDEDKRTQWLLRLSRIVNRDLSPWFALWNIPVHADAPAQLSGLKGWIAEGYPSK
ncbi:MAG: hypothetical protein JNL28_07495 [Planctomycetes bacterium]|nr:hypothetical protein [Planctomycetota bacterium]